MHSPDHLQSSCLGPKEEQGCTLASDSSHTDQQLCGDDQPDKQFTFLLTDWETWSISSTKKKRHFHGRRRIQLRVTVGLLG